MLNINSNNLEFNLGVELTINGEKNTTIEFNRSNSHLLLCGGTGKGKTAFTQHMVTQAMLKSNLDVYVCDLKGTGSYNVFKQCQNLKTLVKTGNETIEVLNTINDIMKDRYKLIDKCNLNSQMDYNKKYKGRQMNNIILIVEEFIMLSHNREAIELLNVLLAQASAAGIFIWLTVQKPDAKTLDTRLKSNLSYTIAFKAKNTHTSEVYLDRGDFRAAKDLHNKGEALLIKDDEDIFFKSYFLEDAEIKRIVQHTYINKEEYKIKPLHKIIKKENPIPKIIKLEDKRELSLID